MTGSKRQRRVELALLATLLGTYAYFHQGGGWNQNARLAQVRAIVEERTLAINDYLVYRHKGRGQLLEREPIPPGVPWESVAGRASTADVVVASSTGRIFPNKPPGAVLVAVPVYALVLAVERLAGADPDRWAVLTVNAHLVTAFSVGLAGALTGVVLLRAGRTLFPDLPLAAHAAAALTCGLSTLMLPFATVLFDHVLTAFWLLLAFSLLARPDADARAAALAGLAAGMGVLTNYMGAIIAGLLALYLVARGRWRLAIPYAAGIVPPLAVLVVYQAACFQAPLLLAKPLPAPSLQREDASLFSWPDPEILWRLLVGGQRGLLVSSPVMAIAAAGLVGAYRSGRRAEAVLAAAVFVAFWLLNAGFGLGMSWWQSGWSIGPRYLIPAIPFVCLGLPLAFARWPRLTGTLATVSMAVLLLATAVDVQPPRRVRNPLRDYVWPLWQQKPLRLSADVEIVGPVSANPVGVYEGGYYGLFGPGSRVPRWNSYNLGELAWPRRRLSLLPLALWLGAGLGLTLAWARGERSPTSGHSTPSSPS